MNLPKREIKNILNGDDAKSKIVSGARKMYETVSSTYGPAGNNVILGMPYGDATLTRDGVTVAKRTILPDRAEDDAATILRQASEKTNKTAGDGTTATIVLGYHLFDRGHSLTVAGESGMLLGKQIAEDSRKVIEFLEAESEDATDHLLDVATVSAGDPAVGALVADTLEEIGTNGGITIREQNYPTIDVEKVGGYYFDKGFFALNQMIEFSKPLIFVTQKQIAANSDIIPLLQRVINGDKKDLIIIGDVRMNSDAMNTLMLNVSQNKLNAIVIPPPAYSDEGLLFMQDIALYVGSKLFLIGDDISAVKSTDDYFGTADRVQVSPDRSIVFGGAGAAEDIEVRTAEIKSAIEKEKSPHRKDNLEQRYSKLTGKIAIVNVGGSTPTEMEELRYRVEDAIEATKSAMADGILPGGATMLVRAAELPISKLFKDALLDSFRKLMTNAAEPADYRLEQVRRAPKGFGFNLRAMTDEPIDLKKAGIFDATRSIVQTVENATSAAGSLLTVNTIVDPIDQKDEDEAA
jgi:chaperonin GroEL